MYWEVLVNSGAHITEIIVLCNKKKVFFLIGRQIILHEMANVKDFLCVLDQLWQILRNTHAWMTCISYY